MKIRKISKKPCCNSLEPIIRRVMIGLPGGMSRLVKVPAWSCTKCGRIFMSDVVEKVKKENKKRATDESDFVSMTRFYLRR